LPIHLASLRGWGYSYGVDLPSQFVAGLMRPLVLLLVWVPLIAAVLWAIRRYLPRWERVLFCRITDLDLGQVARRLLRRGGAERAPSRASRPIDP
jgi:hypothetical protein